MVSVAAGSLPQSKYGGLLGFTGTKMVHPMGRLFGMLCGMPNSGKSCFIQSHPGGMIFNLDKSSTTNENPQATIWPGINSDGETVDADSSRIVLTQKKIKEKFDLLCELAANNKPRPETIFIDSLGAWIGILKPHIAEVNQKEDWHDMDGRRAWDVLYELIIHECERLRRHGYGVFLICHVINAKIPLGDDRLVIRPELTITDGFYKRLYPAFEMVAAFEEEWTSRSIKTERPPQMVSGREVPTPPKIETVSVRRFLFKTEDERMAGIVKARVSVPGTIELPAEDGWRHVLSLYNQTAKQV